MNMSNMAGESEIMVIVGLIEDQKHQIKTESKDEKLKAKEGRIGKDCSPHRDKRAAGRFMFSAGDFLGL